METKRKMEALGKWDEQVDAIAANGLQLMQMKSCNPHQESQKMLHFWGSSHIIVTMTSSHVSVWQYVLKCWMASLRVKKKNPYFGFQVTPGTVEKKFSSAAGEMHPKPRKTKLSHCLERQQGGSVQGEVRGLGRQAGSLTRHPTEL